MFPGKVFSAPFSWSGVHVRPHPEYMAVPEHIGVKNTCSYQAVVGKIAVVSVVAV